MRLILLLTLIVYQLNSIAQKITAKFDIAVSEDDFLSITGKWEQRSTANDFYLTEKGVYIVKNRSQDMFSTSLHVPALNLAKYEVKALIKTDASKRMESSIGVMLNANPEGSGAVVCEINSKNQYRVRKFLNGQWEVLSFAGENGWNYDKALKNKAFNEFMIRHDNGMFDFYINDAFIFSFFERKLVSGNIGVFVGANSSGKVDHIKISKEINTSSVVATDPAKGKEEVPDNSEPTPAENEVVLLLKGKIDKQQKRIAELTKEIERCRILKSTDTSMEIKNIELTQLNETLYIEKGKLEIELKLAKEKVAELEVLKKTLESDTNGDLVLTLNDIINREKKKNKELQNKNTALQNENQQLLNMIKDLQKTKK